MEYSLDYAIDDGWRHNQEFPAPVRRSRSLEGVVGAGDEMHTFAARVRSVSYRHCEAFLRVLCEPGSPSAPPVMLSAAQDK